MYDGCDIVAIKMLIFFQPADPNVMNKFLGNIEADLKSFDWMFQVTWLLLTYQSVLFQHYVFVYHIVSSSKLQKCGIEIVER